MKMPVSCHPRSACTSVYCSNIGGVGEGVNVRNGVSVDLGEPVLWVGWRVSVARATVGVAVRIGTAVGVESTCGEGILHDVVNKIEATEANAQIRKRCSLLTGLRIGKRESRCNLIFKEFSLIFLYLYGDWTVICTVI